MESLAEAEGLAEAKDDMMLEAETWAVCKVTSAVMMVEVWAVVDTLAGAAIAMAAQTEAITAIKKERAAMLTMKKIGYVKVKEMQRETLPGKFLSFIVIDIVAFEVNLYIRSQMKKFRSSWHVSEQNNGSCFWP